MCHYLRNGHCWSIFILLHHDLRVPGFDLGPKEKVVKKTQNKTVTTTTKQNKTKNKKTRKHKMNKTIWYIKGDMVYNDIYSMEKKSKTV